MRPSSLGGGRILRRTLSVRLSAVCPSVPLLFLFTFFTVEPSYERKSKIEKLLFSLMGQRHVCTFRHAQRAAYRTAISVAQTCCLCVYPGPVQYILCVHGSIKCRNHQSTNHQSGRMILVGHTTQSLSLSLSLSLCLSLSVCLSLSLRFNGHFSRWTWVSRCLLKQRMMEVMVTTGLLEL